MKIERDIVLQILSIYRTERWYILEECNSTGVQRKLHISDHNLV